MAYDITTDTEKTGFIGTIRVESSAPTNPETGEIYYDSTTNHLSYYNGSAWVGAPFSQE